MFDFLKEALDEARHRAAIVLLILVALLVCWCCSGCTARRVRPVPSLATAQAIAREQHGAFVQTQRTLDAQAVPLAAARSHSAEAALRARQIDAKAQVILDHW